MSLEALCAAVEYVESRQTETRGFQDSSRLSATSPDGDEDDTYSSYHSVYQRTRSNEKAKQVHNCLEKKRRADLKEKFVDLKRALPGINIRRKVSNLTLLHLALSHIKSLQQQNSRLISQRRKLKEEEWFLIKSLPDLQSSSHLTFQNPNHEATPLSNQIHYRAASPETKSCRRVVQGERTSPDHDNSGKLSMAAIADRDENLFQSQILGECYNEYICQGQCKCRSENGEMESGLSESERTESPITDTADEDSIAGDMNDLSSSASDEAILSYLPNGDCSKTTRRLLLSDVTTSRTIESINSSCASYRRLVSNEISNSVGQTTTNNEKEDLPLLRSVNMTSSLLEESSVLAQSKLAKLHSGNMRQSDFVINSCLGQSENVLQSNAIVQLNTLVQQNAMAQHNTLVQEINALWQNSIVQPNPNVLLQMDTIGYPNNLLLDNQLSNCVASGTSAHPKILEQSTTKLGQQSTIVQPGRPTTLISNAGLSSAVFSPATAVRSGATAVISQNAALGLVAPESIETNCKSTLLTLSGSTMASRSISQANTVANEAMSTGTEKSRHFANKRKLNKNNTNVLKNNIDASVNIPTTVPLPGLFGLHVIGSSNNSTSQQIILQPINILISQNNATMGENNFSNSLIYSNIVETAYNGSVANLSDKSETVSPELQGSSNKKESSGSERTVCKLLQRTIAQRLQQQQHQQLQQKLSINSSSIQENRRQSNVYSIASWQQPKVNESVLQPLPVPSNAATSNLVNATGLQYVSAENLQLLLANSANTFQQQPTSTAALSTQQLARTVTAAVSTRRPVGTAALGLHTPASAAALNIQRLTDSAALGKQDSSNTAQKVVGTTALGTQVSMSSAALGTQRASTSAPDLHKLSASTAALGLLQIDALDLHKLSASTTALGLPLQAGVAALGLQQQAALAASLDLKLLTTNTPTVDLKQFSAGSSVMVVQQQQQQLGLTLQQLQQLQPLLLIPANSSNLAAPGYTKLANASSVANLGKAVNNSNSASGNKKSVKGRSQNGGVPLISTLLGQRSSKASKKQADSLAQDSNSLPFPSSSEVSSTFLSNGIKTHRVSLKSRKIQSLLAPAEQISVPASIASSNNITA